MRIAVIGAGAIGGYFGGRLAHAGTSVVFIARGENLFALRSKGLQVDSPSGAIVVSRVEATDAPVDVGPVDAVIVAVKAWQVPDVAKCIRPLIEREASILPLQNGVEAADQLAEVYGPEHVLGGTCRIIAERIAPGHIRHVGVEPSIALGELNNRNSGRVAALLETFRNAGVVANKPLDIHAAIWKKFLFVAPVSGVAAVARMPLDVVRTVPETRELIWRAMNEVWAVASAKGIALPRDARDKAMAFLDAMPAGSTASMQRDIMEERPSELESINGAVVRMGRALNVETLVNQFIHAILLPMEAKARLNAVNQQSSHANLRHLARPRGEICNAGKSAGPHGRYDPGAEKSSGSGAREYRSAPGPRGVFAL